MENREEGGFPQQYVMTPPDDSPPQLQSKFQQVNMMDYNNFDPNFDKFNTNLDLLTSLDEEPLTGSYTSGTAADYQERERQLDILSTLQSIDNETYPFKSKERILGANNNGNHGGGGQRKKMSDKNGNNVAEMMARRAERAILEFQTIPMSDMSLIEEQTRNHSHENSPFRNNRKSTKKGNIGRFNNHDPTALREKHLRNLSPYNKPVPQHSFKQRYK